MLSKVASSTIFWVFGMNSTWDWTQVSQDFGEHSNHYANVRIQRGRRKMDELKSNARWNRLYLVKCDNDDIVTFAGVVNREWEKFKSNVLTSDSFKCLIFVQSLTSNKNAAITSGILTKLEINSKLLGKMNKRKEKKLASFRTKHLRREN